jgi:hypothetical protein
VSEVQIYRYINGENVPNVNVIVKLARAAGVSIEWLATGDTPKGDELGVQEAGSSYVLVRGDRTRESVIDRSLLGHVVSALENYLDKEALDLPARDRADIISEIYADVVAMPDPESRRAMADSVMASLIRLLRSKIPRTD